MLVAGVDVGSTGTKAALLDENKKICALALVDTGANVVRAAERAFREALAHYGVADPALAWMIGNSIRSDVNPALLVGAHAILVDVPEPWEFDMVEPVSRRFLRARTFADAVEFLLTGRGAEPQGE